MEEHTLTVPGLLEEAQRLQQELREERDRLRLLLDVNNLLVSRLDTPSCCARFPNRCSAWSSTTRRAWRSSIGLRVS